MLIARFLAPSVAKVIPSAIWVLIPIGMAVADTVLAFLFLAGIRAIRRACCLPSWNVCRWPGRWCRPC